MSLMIKKKKKQSSVFYSMKRNSSALGVSCDGGDFGNFTDGGEVTTEKDNKKKRLRDVQYKNVKKKGDVNIIQ